MFVSKECPAPGIVRFQPVAVPQRIKRMVEGTVCTAGNAEMIFSCPRRKWLGRDDPSASVRFYIQIVPD